MNPTRVLYVASATDPFLSMPPLSSHLSTLTETMTLSPEHQVRLLLPRFGVIDQRTNSIYETIRLSGINISMGKDRISLVVKVPSVRGVKTPIYFIDNEDLFERKGVFRDSEGNFYSDNDIRALFFCKSVLSILEKLAWIPHVIHCHGWMSTLLPVYLKNAYIESHPLRQTKCIYTLYEDAFDETLSEEFFKHVRFKQVKKANFEELIPDKVVNFQRMTNLAMQYADKVTRTFDSTSQTAWQDIPYGDTTYVPIDEQAVETYKSLYETMRTF
ncbi:MAG: glycogen/starch synthase [Bacteroidota bacterium]